MLATEREREREREKREREERERERREREEREREGEREREKRERRERERERRERECESSAVLFGKTLLGNAPPAHLRSHNQLALCWRAWTICQPYRLLRIVSLMFRMVVSVPQEISCLSRCQRHQNARFFWGDLRPSRIRNPQ